MLDNENESKDVENATPVETELEGRNNDVLTVKKSESFKKLQESYPRHHCKKEKPVVQEVDCCAIKSQQAAQQKTVKLYVHEEPCKLEKPEIIPRQCLSKEEYIDFLASPKKKCDTSCAKKAVVRKLRSISARNDELAKPMKRKLRLTLEERGMTMSPEMLENIIRYLEGETALTPEQAETMIRDRELMKKQRKKLKKRKKCAKKIERCFEEGDLSLDPETVDRQYSMAQRFIRSIFSWKCDIPCENYRDISDVVLRRLSEHLDYTPVGNEDRKSQQMRILADIIACWISDILIEVSEIHRLEIEAECRRRCQEIKEMEERKRSEIKLRAAEAEEDELDDSLWTGVQVEDDEEENLSEFEVRALFDDDESHKSDVAKVDIGTQYDPTIAEEFEQNEKNAIESASYDSVEFEVIEETCDEELQTENNVCDAQTDADLATISDQCELDMLTKRIQELFGCGVTLVLLGMSLHAIFTMIEKETRCIPKDPMDTQLYKIIRKRFHEAIELDACVSDELAMNVADQVAYKLSKWIRLLLEENGIELKVLDKNSLREKSAWLTKVADVAVDWACWIDNANGEVDNGCWNSTIDKQNWTSKRQNEALHWRSWYQQTERQQFCANSAKEETDKKNSFRKSY